MAAFDYAKTAATAARLLARFGQAATLRRRVTGPYNPALGGPAMTEQDYPCTAAVIDYAARDIDGTLVLQGDKRVLIAPTVAVPPVAGDVLVFAGGSSLRAVSVQTTAPAGVPVLYEVQGRG